MSLHQSDWMEVQRQEVFAEALHHPETAEEHKAQQTKFRSWLNDVRYQHLWPMLERLIEPANTSSLNGTLSANQPIAS